MITEHDLKMAFTDGYKAGVETATEQRKQLVSMLDEKIIRLEAALPKWISVNERLPEENFEVLMLFKHNMAVGWYGGEGDWYSNTDDGYYASCDGEPTHWMPLPEPPKEET